MSIVIDRWRWVLIATVLGLSFGIVDAIIDTGFFYSGSFWETLIYPEPVEVYIRTSVLILFVIFGFIANRTFNELIRTQKLLEKQKRLLEREIHARKQIERSLEFLANHDSLTRIYNRGKMLEQLEISITHASRYGRDLSLIMLDIDNFKQVNDTHGHQMGDETLQRFCSLVKSIIRKSDHFARYGGEEFTIIAPETTQKNAQKLAEKIRNTIEKNRELKKLKITVSAGVSTWQEEDDSDQLIRRADQALYTAKKAGKNRVYAT